MAQNLILAASTTHTPSNTNGADWDNSWTVGMSASSNSKDTYRPYYTWHLFNKAYNVVHVEFKYYCYASTGGQYDRDANATVSCYFTTNGGTTWTPIQGATRSVNKHNATGESRTGRRIVTPETAINIEGEAWSAVGWAQAPAYQDLTHCNGIQFFGSVQTGYSDGGSAEATMIMYEIAVYAKVGGGYAQII